MQTPLEDLLLSEDLSPEARQALREAVAADPELAETLKRWRQVRKAVRHQLNEAVPDRRLLVLHTLASMGRADVLTPEEQTDVQAARPALEQAVAAHPALNDVAGDVVAACADFDAAWTEHTTPPALHRAPDRTTRRPARQMTRWGWRVLATAAVVAFVAVLTLIVQRDQRLQTIAVAEGETRLIELADGSLVRVLGGSSLTFIDPEQGASFDRRVQLQGRAFFDVASGQQGFTVDTPTALTTVLGTSFGMQADDEAMEVVLATGRIAVASKASEDHVVVLEPGEMSRVARNAQPSAPTPVNLAEALDWTGLLIYRDAPVREVVGHLEDRFQVSITMPEAAIRESFTGTFVPEQSIEEILDVLATTLDADVHGDAASGFHLVAW